MGNVCITSHRIWVLSEGRKTKRMASTCISSDPKKTKNKHDNRKTLKLLWKAATLGVPLKCSLHRLCAFSFVM
jgi:hypothetical protein